MNDYAALDTDHNGLAYNGNPAPFAYPYSSQPLIDDGQNSLLFFGSDRATSFRVNFLAPRGSTVASFVTYLIGEVGDQDAAKRALMLEDSVFRLDDPTRDLRTFSWAGAQASSDASTVSDGARVRAADVRLFAYLTAITRFSIGPGYPASTGSDPFVTPVDLAAIIKANPTLRLYTAEGTETVLRALPRHATNGGMYRDSVIKAAASFITRYAVAIGTQITNDADAARYTLGARGYLLPVLSDLMEANTDEVAATVAAIGVSDVYPHTAPFAASPPFSTNLLFPEPDFLRVKHDGQSTVPFYDPFSNGSPSLASNDSTFFLPTGNNYPLSLVSVSVPSEFANAITVSQQADQSVSIQARNGFSGVVWFSYVEKTPGGTTAEGRAYVIVDDK